MISKIVSRTSSIRDEAGRERTSYDLWQPDSPPFSCFSQCRKSPSCFWYTMRPLLASAFPTSLHLKPPRPLPPAPPPTFLSLANTLPHGRRRELQPTRGCRPVCAFLPYTKRQVFQSAQILLRDERPAGWEPCASAAAPLEHPPSRPHIFLPLLSLPVPVVSTGSPPRAAGTRCRGRPAAPSPAPGPPVQHHHDHRDDDTIRQGEGHNHNQR